MQDSADPVGGVLTQAPVNVRVEVRGDGQMGVSKPFRDDLEVDAAHQGQGGVGVPQVVQADLRHVGLPG